MTRGVGWKSAVATGVAVTVGDVDGSHKEEGWVKSTGMEL